MVNKQQYLAKMRQRGQGMTEYIIIVALIAIGAIGVYSAFGDVVRGQTAVVAGDLAGTPAAAGATMRQQGAQQADQRAVTKNLNNYETGNR